MSALRIGSMCSGYGGLDGAVQSVLGGEIAWVADIDPGAAKILAYRLPGVPNHGDITTANWEAAEPVDVLTAGFPCQPVSAAGRRKGLSDERWLFDDICTAVGRMVTRPRLLVLENVPGLLSANGGDAMARVIQGLAALGYEFAYRLVRASDAGAPHRRERWFCLAWLTSREPAADAGRHEPGRHGTVSGNGTGHQGIGSRTGDRIASADAERDGLEGRQPADRAPEGRAAAHGRSPDEGGGSVGGTASRRGREDSPADPGRERLEEHAGEPPAEEAGPIAGDELAGDRRLRASAEWGPYGAAVSRWEAVTGRPAPRPTEPGRTGERLSPRFVEWMQGLPDGWVTGVPGLSRNAQLKALGNGVVPAQAELALRILLDRANLGREAAA